MVAVQHECTRFSAAAAPAQGRRPTGSAKKSRSISDRGFLAASRRGRHGGAFASRVVASSPVLVRSAIALSKTPRVLVAAQNPRSRSLSPVRGRSSRSSRFDCDFLLARVLYNLLWESRKRSKKNESSPGFPSPSKRESSLSARDLSAQSWSREYRNPQVAATRRRRSPNVVGSLALPGFLALNANAHRSSPARGSLPTHQFT